MQVPSLDLLLRDVAARREQLDRQGVYFLGDITDDEAERFSKALLLMAADRRGMPNSPITVYLNSGGGSVGAGVAMMEMINHVRLQDKVPIHTVITGYAYSMGAIVCQAGDRRSMGPYSTMMLHSSSWVLSGDDATIFKDYLKLSEHYQQIVGELFARRTGMHTPRWWVRFIYSGHDRFLSAAECLKLRLVDEVRPISL